MLNRVTAKYFNNLIAIDRATNCWSNQIINIVNFDSLNKAITNDRVDVNTTNLMRFHWHPAERKKKEKRKRKFFVNFDVLFSHISYHSIERKNSKCWTSSCAKHLREITVCVSWDATSYILPQCGIAIHSKRIISELQLEIAILRDRYRWHCAATYNDVRKRKKKER